jgi:hypothetical protein
MSRVLLLHPLDRPSHFIARSKWDLIVDLGRAPASTYEAWSRTADCRILSLYDFNDGTRDLQRVRELLDFGMGEVVDEFGIDWWDVLAQSAVPALQQLILARRLADAVGPTAEIHSTRPHFVATALGHLTGQTLVELQRGQSLFGRAKHYINAFQQLDFRQFTQVLQDKFDPEHNIRRRFNRPKQRSADSFILLPSAYVNVSRTAVACADMVPDASFLLVTGRNSGRLATLPANVQMESLDGYFSGIDQREMNSLVERWSRLELKLSESAKELAAAKASGVLANAKALLRWGVAVRNGWLAVFESQNISSCLCADDSNPYSRIPLILAGKRGIPALTCHHGALDSRVAIKTQHADLYLAKGEMESDYLTRVCQLAPERIVLSAPVSSPAIRPPGSANMLPNWLVFFTEPYQAMGWRTEDIYAELLPRLLLLEKQCKLELVFKLHPFESIKGHRRLLRRFFTPAKTRQVRIIAGPTIPEFWSRVGCALTVQSTVALDCAERNIPIFLCGWLADSLSGYAQQYARFGIGHLLESPQQMATVSELIAKAETPRSPMTRPIIAPETLRRVLSGTYSRAAVLSA